MRDEINAQKGSLATDGGTGGKDVATHVVTADYTPSFDRALAASNGQEMVRLPQTTETAEVRFNRDRLVSIAALVLKRYIWMVFGFAVSCSGLKCGE